MSKRRSSNRKQRRTNADIISTILESANGQILPSKLIVEANLNSHRLAKYTDLLIKRGLLTTRKIVYPNGKKRKIYSTTDDGIRFLSMCKNFKDVTDDIGSCIIEGRRDKWNKRTGGSFPATY